MYDIFLVYQKVKYNHNNPDKAGFVDPLEEYLIEVQEVRTALMG
ncbi:MAG TPA: hypothetical protein VKA34_04925 [Balneolales bacterium]|nr:hypothetical protein [Balneolales bacterium]